MFIKNKNMKCALYITFGFILGLSVFYLIFKMQNLAYVIQMHGLKAAMAPKNMIVWNNDKNDTPLKLPDGTVVYYVKSTTEAYDQYIIFINLEGTKLNPAHTKVKTPLIGYVDTTKATND